MKFQKFLIFHFWVCVTDSPWCSFFRIYLGATTREFPNNYKYKYDIESVRQPEATIEMYKRGAYFTSQSETGNDIALIKLKTKVVFIPMKISPVGLQ